MITNSVFVLSKNGKILKPTTPARARILQAQGKVKKLKLFPFTLVLQKEIDEDVEPYLELRLDSTRKAIFEMAHQFGLPVIQGDGASTKMIRIKSGLPKAHWIDSGCVSSTETIKLRICQPLRVTCKGHGTRQVQRVNASGFPAIASIKKNPVTGKKEVKLVAKNQKYTHATAGDYVICNLMKDRKHIKAGIYRARVKTPTEKGVEVLINSHRIAIDRQHIKLIHRSDGYEYSFTTIDPNLLRFNAI